MKIRPVEPSCSMRKDRRTDTHDEATSRFSQFLWTRLKHTRTLWEERKMFYLVMCKVTTVRVNLFYIVHSVHNWEQFHDTKPTKYTNLFPRYLNYSITLNISTCFDPQETFIRELTKIIQHKETAVEQWLRCCATNWKVAGSIPACVIEIFIDIKSFRSHYGPGVDSASNSNEYQEHFLGVKAAGAYGWQPYHHPVPLLWNLGTLTSWIPLGHSRAVTGLPFLFNTAK